VIIQYRDRPEGSESKLTTYSDGIKVILTIIKLYKNYKPMGFFSWIALALALISTIFLLPVMAEYFDTGLVERFPTLIVCCFVYIAAIQSFFAGLMLSTMRQKNLHDYEMNLIFLDSEYKTKLKDSI
ncbi:MAG: glycosyl transferase, partial [Lachnospiraceae bacterium]|nr:glycosyl transferase [Lachnospiraceae bacterium]